MPTCGGPYQLHAYIAGGLGHSTGRSAATSGQCSLLRQAESGGTRSRPLCQRCGVPFSYLPAMNAQRFADALALRNPQSRRLTGAAAALLPCILFGAAAIGLVDITVGLGASAAAIILLQVALMEGLAQTSQDQARFDARISDQLATVSKQNATATQGLIVREDILEHPWVELFSAAASVEVVAKFFDAVLRDRIRSDAVIGFFARGGTVRMVTLHPESRITVSSPNERPDIDPSRGRSFVLKRAADTVAQLDALRKEAGADATAITVFPCAGPLYWAGIRFDDSVLTFVSYEPLVARTRAPRLEIDLRIRHEFNSFWCSQFEGYTNGETKGSHRGEPLSAQQYVALHDSKARAQ